ncbi:uncharacterized protein LOC125030375 [Penaeus chinensis]|uniref:uncharacterized protein LOC125030375 n=1 Tax=Penaeus chinensis TaxID=139456 RepID=UPI001FB59BDA|nr:uncharacterized protein LOC125030375 [Penaeus chinensis]
MLGSALDALYDLLAILNTTSATTRFVLRYIEIEGCQENSTAITGKVFDVVKQIVDELCEAVLQDAGSGNAEVVQCLEDKMYEMAGNLRKLGISETEKGILRCHITNAINLLQDYREGIPISVMQECL